MGRARSALVPRTHRLPGCFVPGSQVGDKLLRSGFRTHAQRHDAEGATNGIDALPQEAYVQQLSRCKLRSLAPSDAAAQNAEPRQDGAACGERIHLRVRQ